MADVPVVSLDPYLLAVQGVLAALQAAGLIPDLDPIDYIIGLFNGKPTEEDTAVAAALLQSSTYWPVQALGRNLEIWVRNQVPLSTGKTALRAQLSEWIRGTIDTLEPLIFNRGDPLKLDTLIWRVMTSQWGSEGLTQLDAYLDAQKALGPLPPLPTPPPSAGGGGGGPQEVPPPGTVPGNPCVSFNPDTDEVLDSCNAAQAGFQMIADLLAGLKPSAGGGVDPACCQNVVFAIGQINSALINIWTTLETLGGSGGGTPVDLSGIVAQLEAMAAAIQALAPASATATATLKDGLAAVASAVASAPAADVTGVVDALKTANADNDVPQAIIDAVARLGLVSGADAQLAGGGPFQRIATLLHDEWRKLNHPPSPEELAALKADPVYGPAVSAKLAGLPTPSFKDVLKNTPGVMGEISKTVVKTGADVTFAASEKVFEPVIRELLGVHEKYIGKFVNVKPGDEVTNAAALLSEALGAGVLAHWTAVGAEMLFPSKNLGLSQLAALVAELAGFAEISKGLIGAEVKEAIAIPHGYFIANQARPNLPDQQRALEWFARGIITAAQRDSLVGYSGLSRDYEAVAQTGSYGGVRPMVLIRVLQSGAFTDDEIRDEMTFAAMRPASQERMITAGHFLAADPYRKQLQAALEQAYNQGLLTDAQLTTQIDSSRHTNDIDQLILQRAQVLKVITQTREFETAYLDLALATVIDIPTYQNDLETLGLQPDAISAKLAVLEARLSASQRKQEIAAERRLEAQTTAALRKAARQNFMSGTIDAAGYAAALIATGLTVTEAAAFTDFAALQQKGNQRFLYGIQVTPEAAQLLRERVAALTDQRKKLLIDDAEYLAFLSALGIPTSVQNSLLAAAAALTTPKSQATLINVQT